MLMKPADDWCYKPQRGQRNSTARPRSLRNMGRRLSNEIRPRKMKVDMSGRNDEGASWWGLANLESRDGWQNQEVEWGDKVWGVLGESEKLALRTRGTNAQCISGRTDCSRKTGAELWGQQCAARVPSRFLRRIGLVAPGWPLPSQP